MKKDDYIQLIHNSRAFQALNNDLQTAVLMAEGSLMKMYVKIFEDEKNLLESATRNFLATNGKIVDKVTMKIKKLKKGKFAKAEIISKKSDEQQEEELLKQIDHL